MAVSNLVAASAGKSQYVTRFTSSGTFTLPAGYDSNNPLWVQVLMGGGGGGGGGGGASNGTSAGGGGGGGSGIVTEFYTYLTANQTVTIGAGGTGGAGGTQNANINGVAGQSGGITFFGSYAVPGAGGGGGGSNNSSQSAPGTSNLAGIYQYFIQGGSGNNTMLGFGGPGGSGGGPGNTAGASWGHGSSNTGLNYSAKGGGLLDVPVFSPTGSPSMTSVSNRHDFNQRGGGAGGYQTSNDGQWGKGGLAGGIVGGLAQAAQTTTASEAIGGTATEPSAGGGGGGGGRGLTGGNAGAGGAGASGFVTVIYWA